MWGFLWAREPCGLSLCTLAPFEDESLLCSLEVTELEGVRCWARVLGAYSTV